METEKFNTGRVVYPEIDVHRTRNVFSEGRHFKRIETIQSMKENLSLDEMAEMFTPGLSELSASRGELLEKGIVSQAVMTFFEECTGKRDDPFHLTEALAAYVLEGLLQSGDISLDEGKMVLDVIMSHEAENKGRLIVLRSSALQHV